MAKWKVKKADALNRLSETAKAVTFSKYNQPQIDFSVKLRDLIGDTFGYNARHETRYDDDKQVYYWEEEEYLGKLNGLGVKTTCTFAVDPTKPLFDEFARVCKEYEAMREARIALCRLIAQAGGDLS
jgi:hypothetical protein